MSTTMSILKNCILYFLHTSNKIFLYRYIHKKYYIFFLAQLLSMLYTCSSIAKVNEKSVSSTRITHQEQQNIASEFIQAQQEYINIKNLLNMNFLYFDELQTSYLESLTTQNSMIDLYLNTISREGEDSFNYEEIQRMKVNQQRLTGQLTYILQSITSRMQELQANIVAIEEMQLIVGQQEGISEIIALNNDHLQRILNSQQFIYNSIFNEHLMLRFRIMLVEKIEQARQQGHPLPPFPNKEIRMGNSILQEVILKDPPKKRESSLRKRCLETDLSSSSDEEAKLSPQQLVQRQIGQSSDYDASSEASDEESQPYPQSSRSVYLFPRNIQSSKDRTSSLVAIYKKVLQLEPLLGVQYVFHDMLARFPIELKQLATTITNNLSDKLSNHIDEKFFNTLERTSTGRIKKDKGVTVIPNIPLSDKRMQSMLGMMKDCPFCISTRPQTRKRSYVSNTISNITLGLGYDHNKYNSKIHNGILSSIAAKVQIKGLLATLSWGKNKCGLTGCVMGAHYWGQMHTIQSMPFNITKKKSIPVRFSGVLAQLGYKIPLGSEHSLMPYIGSSYVVGTSNSYYKELSPFFYLSDKHKESVYDHVIGLCLYSKIKDFSSIQFWFEKNYRQQNLNILNISSLLQSKPLYKSYLQGYKKNNIYSETGISFEYTINDVLTIHARNCFTLHNMKNIFYIQTQCNFLYTF